MHYVLVSVVVRPMLLQPQTLERARRELEPVCRIFIRQIPDGVVTGRIVVAVFKKAHIVTKLLETDDVLEVMPGNSAEWSSHDVSEHEDAQSGGVTHGTGAKISNDVSSMFWSAITARAE